MKLVVAVMSLSKLDGHVFGQYSAIQIWSLIAGDEANK